MKAYIPLLARMLVSRLREVRGWRDIAGRFGSAGLRAYVASSVKARHWRHIEVGREAQIHRGTVLHSNDDDDGKRILVGDRVFIGQNCFFSAGELIDLQQDSLVGASCNLLGAGHSYEDPSVPYARASIVSYGRITLGPNSWLGTGTTIVGAVRIGFGSVIAAGTVLRCSVPALCLVVGNPGRIHKTFDWQTHQWQSLPDLEIERQRALEQHVAKLPSLDEFLHRLNRVI
jgi:acetyltransferase-like isoleucine patch superfamily enzyme